MQVRRDGTWTFLDWQICIGDEQMLTRTRATAGRELHSINDMNEISGASALN